jgi:hypothetical protein
MSRGNYDLKHKSYVFSFGLSKETKPSSFVQTKEPKIAEPTLSCGVFGFQGDRRCGTPVGRSKIILDYYGFLTGPRE